MYLVAVKNTLNTKKQLEKIKKHMKIFSIQPKLSKRDISRLTPLLCNYNYLVEELSLNANVYTQTDLKKLILIELKNKKRNFILKKLTSRIISEERRNILGAIEKCLKANLRRK